MPFNMGPGEIILIFILVILLFGAKRLPELARSLGRSIKEFKHATQGLRDELDLDKVDEPPRRPQATPRAGENVEKETPPQPKQDA